MQKYFWIFHLGDLQSIISKIQKQKKNSLKIQIKSEWRGKPKIKNYQKKGGN